MRLVLCTAYFYSYLHSLWIVFFYDTTGGFALSSTARFSNLLLFSRVPAVNNEFHVASRGSMKHRGRMVSSLFPIRETTVFEDSD
jgi:hypothetical protein